MAEKFEWKRNESGEGNSASGHLPEEPPAGPSSRTRSNGPGATGRPLPAGAFVTRHRCRGMEQRASRGLLGGYLWGAVS